MRPPDSIQILLRVRCRREEIEEGKLADIIKRLRLVESKLADLSVELQDITTKRLGEIQFIQPNVHFQAVEAHSRMLWRKCADCAAEIRQLKEAHTQQMSVYLLARREREVIENLEKQRSDVIEMEKRVREQKLSEDLFRARSVAKRDTWS